VSSRRSVAVLGAGALGLTAALRLTQRGYHVSVFEKEPMPGGLAAGFPVGDVYLEKFYHHIFRSDVHIQALIRELGLSDLLEWSSPKTALLWQQKMWPFDSAQSVLRFTPLPLPDRVRLGAAVGYLRLLPRPWDWSGVSAARWIRASMGDTAYSVVWQPLLESKFGRHQDDIAMPWFWARVHDRSRELGYVRGGFQVFYEALQRRVTELGSEVHLGASVKEIRNRGNRLTVATDQGEDAFSAVVSTLPTPALLRLAPQLPENYRERFGKVAALGAISLILRLDRRLTDVYWVNVNDTGYPFQPFVEHTNFADPDRYGGHIVYLGKYLEMSDPLFAMSKEEVMELFLPSIPAFAPAFNEAKILETWLFKAPNAQPVVTSGFRELIPPHLTPISGLYTANMFQVYPHDRGQNYSVALANRLVARTF
jgi:protoporphyrinogen oxidase